MLLRLRVMLLRLPVRMLLSNSHLRLRRPWRHAGSAVGVLWISLSLAWVLCVVRLLLLLLVLIHLLLMVLRSLLMLLHWIAWSIPLSRAGEPMLRLVLRLRGCANGSAGRIAMRQARGWGLARRTRILHVGVTVRRLRLGQLLSISRLVSIWLAVLLRGRRTVLWMLLHLRVWGLLRVRLMLGHLRLHATRHWRPLVHRLGQGLAGALLIVWGRGRVGHRRPTLVRKIPLLLIGVRHPSRHAGRPVGLPG